MGEKIRKIFGSNKRMKKLVEHINKSIDYKNRDVSLMSPLTLAMVGDSVYDLYVRMRLINSEDFSVNSVHSIATKYVSARGQNSSIKLISESLNDFELGLYRRGKNAKSATIPKNTPPRIYKSATGFEVLLGYLLLDGQDDRLYEIMEMAFDAVTMKGAKSEPS